jgi:hypothetical protein
MRDSHITFRVPGDLARALAKGARERGLPKSHVVREALTEYLAKGASPAASREVTAAELAARWPSLPRLTEGEARSFGDDIAAAREALPSVRSWE